MQARAVARMHLARTSPTGTLWQLKHRFVWAAVLTTQVPAGALGAQGAGGLSTSKQLGRKSAEVWGQLQVGAPPPCALRSRHSPAPGAQMAGGSGTDSLSTGVMFSTLTLPPLVSHTVAA